MGRLGPVLVVAVLAAVLGIGGGVLAGLDRSAHVTDPGDGAPAKPKVFTEAEDPEHIGALLQNQPCDPTGADTLILVAWGDGYSTLRSAVTDWDGVRYLRTDRSCDTRWPRMPGGGTPTYVVYLPPYSDAQSACRDRMTAAHKGDFATRLRAGNKIPVICPCVLGSADLPGLQMEQTNLTRRMFTTVYQKMLVDTGYLPQDTETDRGDFDSRTMTATMILQTDAGLNATGGVGPQTWNAIKNKACRLYNF
jgi:peptidoglycan hydrolase-like protein with peptidoglycan-binding domain